MFSSSHGPTFVFNESWAAIADACACDILTLVTKVAEGKSDHWTWSMYEFDANGAVAGCTVQRVTERTTRELLPLRQTVGGKSARNARACTISPKWHVYV